MDEVRSNCSSAGLGVQARAVGKAKVRGSGWAVASMARVSSPPSWAGTTAALCSTP